MSEKKMKTLSVIGFFALPEDFDGTAEDAIEEWLAYRRRKNLSKNFDDPSTIIGPAKVDVGPLWDDYLSVIDENAHVSAQWVEDDDLPHFLGAVMVYEHDAPPYKSITEIADEKE